MALVKNPFMSGQASGKVGSMVAARNRTGPYIRQNGKPVQPRTSTQQSVRYTFIKLSNGFLNLTNSQQDQWEDFANNYTVPNRLGDAVNLTAINWYIALNSRLDRINEGPLTTPPLNPEASFTPYVSIAQTAAGNPITIGIGTTGTATQAVWVYGTNALLKSRNFKAGSMRLLSIFTGLSQAVDKTLIAALDLTMDGPKYQFEAIAVDSSGRATSPLRFDVLPIDT